MPLLPAAPAAPPLPCREESDPSIRAQVWSLLATMYPVDRYDERRQQDRFPYPHLVQLTPVEDERLTEAAPPVMAAGKHLSERGMGFYHPNPLPYRRVVATLERAPGKFIHLLLQLSWCRFIRHGWYESGGKFLRVLPQFEAGGSW
jgi:hypothetical protein